MSTQAPAFDATIYDLPIPKVDGLKADRLEIVVGGSVKLDRTSRTDLDLISDFKVGERATLTVEVVCVGKPATYTPGKDDDTPGTVTHRTQLRVTAVQQ